MFFRLDCSHEREEHTINFFLNNQPDAQIIQILFCYKPRHVSGIFSARHQEFSAVHSALVSFIQVPNDRFQAVRMEHPDSAWKRSSETCMKLLPSRVRMEHPNSAWKRSSETCVKINSAECTVENS